ncbi:sensor histidine kinase [Alteromonas pelagimontana]|uniref:histidine kinase n=1 Tax=Alteromonas pelagimontana TaxID=1858656 RepID=A0A6M4ME63_9ALTE|nr:sensor histidine kinase [Alteromonas pelagimontana]QJR81474.1 sensor histidine kinase [Alteromonas pelagimontana]
MKVALLTVDIETEADVVLVRQRSRQISALLEFDKHDQTRISTAVSEIARNAFMFAKGGKARFSLEGNLPTYLTISIADSGPGITDLPGILRGVGGSKGKSTFGLKGCKRVMDQFSVETGPNSGTTVYLKKALPITAPLVTKAGIDLLNKQLAKIAPPSPLDIIRQQNQELLHTLDELKERQYALEKAKAAESAARAEAEAAVKARDEIMAIVSHDLRNPLNTISSTALVLEQLIETGKISSQVGKFSDMIARSAARMERLISDMFDLASIEAGQLAVECHQYNAKSLVNESIDHLSTLTMPKLQQLIGDTEPNLEVHCDKDRVHQILSNLIGNATKFTPEGGTISVQVQKRNTEARFCVKDTGCGISADELPHTFDRFWQAKHTRKNGMGLGLSIVKGLVEAQNGQVWVESELGQGTSFYFTLPLSQSAQAEECHS